MFTNCHLFKKKSISHVCVQKRVFQLKRLKYFINSSPKQNRENLKTDSKRLESSKSIKAPLIAKLKMLSNYNSLFKNEVLKKERTIFIGKLFHNKIKLHILA